jgi:hypothetical protein
MSKHVNTGTYEREAHSILKYCTVAKTAYKSGKICKLKIRRI